MAWIMKITKHLHFRPPVSKAPSLREQFLDEAQAARNELPAEIQSSAETDAGEDPAEDEQADALFYQASTSPFLAPQACGKTMLHVFL